MKKRGFTLIEMLIVIMIIMILIGITFKISVLVTQRTGRARTVADLEHIRNFLDQYYTVNGHYPECVGTAWTAWEEGTLPPNWSQIQDTYRTANGSEIEDDIGFKNLVYFMKHSSFKKNFPRWMEYVDRIKGLGNPSEKAEYDTAELGMGGGEVSYTNPVYGIWDAWDTEIFYSSAPPCQTYSLWSAGPDGVYDTADDIGNKKWTE